MDSGVEGVALLTIFVLSAFTGYEVISKVSTVLHTPLLSGANAIHGVILVGAILVAGTAEGPVELAIGLLAVTLATVNLVGGFVVTDRMLQMFGRGRPALAGGGSTGGSGGGPGGGSGRTRESKGAGSGGGKNPAKKSAPAKKTPAKGSPTSPTPTEPAERSEPSSQQADRPDQSARAGGDGRSSDERGTDEQGPDQQGANQDG